MKGVALVTLLAGTAGCGRPSPTARVAPTDGSLVDLQAARGVTVALLYSSNLQGEYAPCACADHPVGGLVRRATIIERARAEMDGVLVVDAGDMLLPPPGHQPDQRLATATAKRPAAAGELERRARLILEAYARLGVQAMLPAERDLAIGPAKLKQLLTVSGVPAVASNLRDGRGRPLFDRDRLVTVAGISVGIFGVVQPQREDRALWERWQIQAADPTETARAEVSDLRARGAQLIVALLHLGRSGAGAALLRAVPGITFAVQGHSDRQLDTPEDIGGARLVEAMSQGKLAGRLDLHVVGGDFSFVDRGERAQVLTIAADHRRQLGDLERQAASDTTDQLRVYYQLRREGIAAAIARETALARALPVVVQGSWFENRIIPLDDTIPDHPGMARLVATYDAESRRRAAAGLPVGIAMRD